MGSDSGQQIYLRDVADVRTRLRRTAQQRVAVRRAPCHRAWGSRPSQGGNVVVMGEAIEARMQELAERIPLGVEFGVISLQSQAVTTAINGFLVSLIEAVVIVVVVLLLFMGLRSALIIGAVLTLTILATFIFMSPWGVALERISLGALVIALGMLVDNAIVVVDGMLVRINEGQDAEEAARDVVAQQSLPLLGATAVAIMAFGAIGLSQDSTGEFCRSLFQVVFLSLGLSWLTGMTVTPLLCVMFLKPEKQKAGDEPKDPYGGFVFRMYRALLLSAIRFRWVTVLVVLVVFGISLWGFQFVDNSFFPDSTRPQFMVDVWLPQGTHIDETVRTSEEIQQYLAGLEGATHVTTLAGAGGMRFLVTYAPEKANSAYVQFLVDVEDYTMIDGLIPQVEEALAGRVSRRRGLRQKVPARSGRPAARSKPASAAPIRTCCAGWPSRTMDILHDDGGAKAIRTDWRQRVKVMRPILAEEEANNAGVTAQDVALAVKVQF